MLEQIIPMQEFALVGRFFGRYKKEKSSRDWLVKVWVNVLGYIPIFHILSREWSTFIFRMGQTLKILEKEDGCGDLQC